MTHYRAWLMPVAAIAALLAAAPANGANVIVNGGFEEPAGYGIFPAGSSLLTGWTVGGDSVEVIPNGFYWTAFQGDQSLDLDGNGPGVISQSFATMVGQSYTLAFAYGNNPGNLGSSANVTVTGSANLLNESISHTTSTFPDMHYTLFSRSFIADSTTTTLSFASTDGTAYGIVLDAVSVSADAIASVPEPSSLVLGALGITGVLGFRRRSRVRGIPRTGPPVPPHGGIR